MLKLCVTVVSMYVYAQPDAWIWLGDMAYLDYPSVNCAVLPQDAQCNCADENTAFKVEPFCLSGDEQHSLLKVCIIQIAHSILA
jgi:hypothetical protein